MTLRGETMTIRRRTWLCGVPGCGREISQSHMKRHLAAHDRAGADRTATDAEWIAFADATGRRVERT